MDITTSEAAVAAHYGLLLGIQSPWKVKRACLEVGRKLVDIEIAHDPDVAVKCPTCGRQCPRHDHSPERTWRHLDVMQFTTQIRARLPRCECAEHGVLTLSAPWAGPGSRFTLMFEAFAIEVISACASLAQAARLLSLDWDSLQRIINAAVDRGLARRSTEEVKYVGLDEKSFGRGHDYVSVMADLNGRRILEVMPDRTTEAAVALWEQLPQRQQVDAVAIDMSAAFFTATVTCAPQAAIVHDKFHVSKLLNDAIDKVRRREVRTLEEQDDACLKHTRYWWYQTEPLEGHKAERFSELCARNLKTSKAWFYKELFSEFWLQGDRTCAHTFFNNWYSQAIRSKLTPIKQVARTLKDHLQGLLSYFQHPITNAVTEGFNSRIQSIKSAARGFRSFKNYRARILFFCGKLHLAPDLNSAVTH